MNRFSDIPSPGESAPLADAEPSGQAGNGPSQMSGDFAAASPSPASDASRPDVPEGPRTVFARLIMPADDWARGAAGGPRTLHVLIAMLLVAIVVAALAALAGYRGLLSAASALNLILLALVVAALAALGTLRKIRRDLHEPLVALNRWALGMCSGDFSTRMAIPKSHPSTRGAVQNLAFHVNRLSEALEGLADNMDEVVWRQTEGLREKNASLELLYEVAASVARHDSLREALHDSTKALMQRVGATAAVIALRDADGALETMDRISPEAEDFQAPLDEASKGTGGVALNIELDHQGKNFGMIRLSGEEFLMFEGRQGERLLASVGNHLGMMVAKARTDEESKSLSIIRERAAIAHELHDSLAQTIAGLRVQTNLLADSLAASGVVPRELARIQSSLDDANVDLRELIAGFRAPLRERDLPTLLEDIAGRFRARSGMDVHLRIERDLPALAPAAQRQVVRIIGEALANAGAHSQGCLARVLVRKEGAGLRVLVEDDGKGFTIPCTVDGDHIGLSVMEDRAREIGGEIVIESEPGEGTRVILEFPIADEIVAEAEAEVVAETEAEIEA